MELPFTKKASAPKPAQPANTTRDYLAGCALSGLLAFDSSRSPEQVAAKAQAIADATVAQLALTSPEQQG